jgi:hypothetical protein
MLFGETVAVYCENHTERTDTLFGQNVEFVPHRKHITSPIKSPPVNDVWGNSRCLLWKPYGTHRYTVWADYGGFTSQETLYVSATKPNRLMMFGERVIAYCENHTDTDTLCGQNEEMYLTGNILRLRYKPQPVNAVWGNIRCLLWGPYGTHRYTL